MFDHFEEVTVAGHDYRVYGDYRYKSEEARCVGCGKKGFMEVRYLHHVAEVINNESTIRIPLKSPRGRMVVKAMRRKLESEIRCHSCPDADEEISDPL
jgi:hypothetical protein